MSGKRQNFSLRSPKGRSDERKEPKLVSPLTRDKMNERRKEKLLPPLIGNDFWGRAWKPGPDRGLSPVGDGLVGVFLVDEMAGAIERVHKDFAYASDREGTGCKGKNALGDAFYVPIQIAAVDGQP